MPCPRQQSSSHVASPALTAGAIKNNYHNHRRLLSCQQVGVSIAIQRSKLPILNRPGLCGRRIALQLVHRTRMT